MNTCSVHVLPQNWWRPLLIPLTPLINPSSSRLSNFNHLCKFFPRWLTVPIPTSDIWGNCYNIEIFQVFKLATTQNDTLNGTQTQNRFLAFSTLFSESFFFPIYTNFPIPGCTEFTSWLCSEFFPLPKSNWTIWSLVFFFFFSSAFHPCFLTWVPAVFLLLTQLMCKPFPTSITELSLRLFWHLGFWFLLYFNYSNRINHTRNYIAKGYFFFLGTQQLFGKQKRNTGEVKTFQGWIALSSICHVIWRLPNPLKGNWS